MQLGIECGDSGGVGPGLHQRSGGVEGLGESWGLVSVAGGVAEETSGFVDLFVEDEGVAQSYLGTGVAADKGAVVSV